MRSISILGATGSIGASTLDLVRRNRDDWRVVALTARGQADELAALAREFGAKLAVVSDESCLPRLRAALAGTGIASAGGTQGLVEAASRGVDVTVAALNRAGGRGEAVRASLRRRWATIEACEATPVGRLRGAAVAARSAVQKAAGKAEEAVGKRTDDEELTKQGHKDQHMSDERLQTEKAKDDLGQS